MASLGFGATMFAIRRQLLAPRLSNTLRARPFTNANFRCQASVKTVPKITVTNPPPSPTARTRLKLEAAPTIPHTRYAFVKTLGSRQTPTLLYEAPSHFWFYFGCWSSGLSIIAWTALTGPMTIKQPEGTPAFVGYVFGTCYMLLSCMAFYLIFKTSSVVSKIRLLPTATSMAPPAPGAAAAAAAAAAASMPLMEITVRRMMPMFGSKVLIAGLDSVALKSHFYLPEEQAPGLRRVPQVPGQEKERPREFDMMRLLMIPFQYLGLGILGFFRGVRTAWTNMGFATMKVNGQEYKVDVTGGYAHDGFKTLERLVPVSY